MFSVTLLEKILNVHILRYLVSYTHYIAAPIWNEILQYFCTFI